MFALWIYFFQKSALCCRPLCILARSIPLTDTFKSAWTTQCSKGLRFPAGTSDWIITIAQFPRIVFVLTAQHRLGDQSHFHYIQREECEDTSTGTSQQHNFPSLFFLTLSCGYCIFTFSAKVCCWFHYRRRGIFFWRGSKEQKLNI